MKADQRSELVRRIERFKWEIARIRHAQRLMHRANGALKGGHEERLRVMGFSEEHIEYFQMLRQVGMNAFPVSAFMNNDELIRRLQAEIEKS